MSKCPTYSRTSYDTDSWSSPRSLVTPPIGVVSRPMGISRTLWENPDNTAIIESDTGILELNHQDKWPCITINPVKGGYEDNGNGHRDAWVEGRDVYLAFDNKVGNPRDATKDWDTDNE